jgi:hypothetical protein
MLEDLLKVRCDWRLCVVSYLVPGNHLEQLCKIVLHGLWVSNDA